MSLRDTILTASDLTTERVSVPEWGVEIDVKTMTGGERARIMQAAAESGGKVDFEKVYPDIVIGCAYDPTTGERIFNWDDREAIMLKSGAAIDRVAQVALRLSGFTEAAETAAGKGSSTNPSGAPTTS